MTKPLPLKVGDRVKAVRPNIFAMDMGERAFVLAILDPYNDGEQHLKIKASMSLYNCIQTGPRNELRKLPGRKEGA